MSEMSARFRGFLPVVIDLETGGFDKDVHAVLQIAAVSLGRSDGWLDIEEIQSWNVIPHPGTRVEDASLKITGIDLADPDRDALSEEEAVRALFRFVRREVRRNGCERAVLTAHNAHFDHGFRDVCRRA